MDRVNIKRNFFGVPGLPIPIVYLKATLALIAQAGKNLQKRNIVTPDMDENPITYLLEDEMRSAQQNGLSDMLIINVRANMPFDPSNPLIRCEIDIKFQWSEYPSNPEKYLAVEAKKLYGCGRSLAGDYVDDGVMDFINGKYASGHNYGIMLGYIVASPIDKAVGSVKIAMNKRRAITKEQSSFALNDSLCLHPHTHHSTHLPISGAPVITLIHVFLGLYQKENEH